MMKPCQAPLNKAPPAKGKGRTKREDPSLSQKSKIKSESQKGEGTNYVPKPLPIIQSISKKGRET
jgi:hypothetical protein